MFEINPLSASRATHTLRPSVAFAGLAVGLMVGIGVIAYGAFGSPLVPMIVFTLIFAVGLRGLLHSYPYHVLGACNVVTLVRTAIVALLTGAIFGPEAPWLVFGLAIVAFASDGIDGWLARRAGLSSVFGARFDMEADALLGATLALILLTHGTTGLAILVLGFSRYIFVAAGWVWSSLQDPLPPSYRRKLICVVQIAALIVLVCPLTPEAAIPGIAIGAAALLLYSFTVDAWALCRRAT